MEEFRTLVYQGVIYPQFEISKNGVLRNVKSGHIYKTTVNKSTGYEGVCVSLGSRAVKKLLKIHKCVAETFIPRVDGKDYINHIDGVRTNNKISNLEWCTIRENNQHGYDTGQHKQGRGEDSQCSKLTNTQVEWIRKNYIPYSKTLGARALGRKFDVDHTTISYIVNNKTYLGN